MTRGDNPAAVAAVDVTASAYRVLRFSFLKDPSLIDPESFALELELTSLSVPKEQSPEVLLRSTQLCETDETDRFSGEQLRVTSGFRFPARRAVLEHKVELD